MGGSTLPERVGQLYYTYGLFCSSYPVTAIAVAVSLVLICCYPLLNVPLPGTIPTVVTIPLNANGGVVNQSTFFTNVESVDIDTYEKGELIGNNSGSLEGLLNETHKLPYLWAKDKPLLYVQQIILKTGVTPWNHNLRLWDAFRGPLQEAYRLLETIRNHQDPEMSSTFSNLCYHVDTVKRRDYKEGKEQARILPEYSCLILSPANLWQQNLQKFALDSNIVNTIFDYQNLQKGRVSTAEMVFGMQLKEAGIKRYPLRSRPRALQYAVTLFFQNIDERYVNSLKQKLVETYPLHQDIPKSIADQVTLTYYPGKFNYQELVPLSISFVGLFLYVYFSVRKIEFVKSKFGLAICSVITIAGSLSMSMGLCFFFGLSLSLQGKEIFPYLVILVGLENVLVLTKSVTSTDSRLDVKIRLAQGLSREGWSITKNLLIEITILTVSLFTFVPVIQEFSIFMIVSLISDFFIQMVFFATILGIDVRRMEYFQEQNNKLQLKEYFNSTHALNWRFANTSDVNTEERTTGSPHKMIKSKSHPRLNGLNNSTHTDVVASLQNSPGKHDKKLPKRIQLVNIWARTRFFQRAFMIWMVVWISIIVYNSGIIEHLVGSINADTGDAAHDGPGNGAKMDNAEMPHASSSVYDFYNHSMGERAADAFSPLLENTNYENEYNEGNESISLKHSYHLRPWRRLSKYHWSSILSQYNVSTAGRYVATLPPILLSCRIGPELALNLRHPDEKDPPPLRWQALAAALDPIDIITDLELSETVKGQTHQWGKTSYTSELPIYPTTPMEILLLAILCGISIVVIAYTMVVFYKVVCTRNYDEWRASWSEGEDYLRLSSKQQPAIQLVMEAVPLVVSGHGHEVECLVTDGERIVSSCLQGTLKVWHAGSGDMVTKIDRFMYFKLQKDMYDKLNVERRDAHKLENSHSDYESPIKKEEINEAEKTSVKLPSQKTAVPELKTDLKSYLQGLKSRNHTNSPQLALEHLPTIERTKFEFAKYYRELYINVPPRELLESADLAWTPSEQDTSMDNDTTTDSKESECGITSNEGSVDPNGEIFIFKSNGSDARSTLRNRVKDKLTNAIDTSLVYSEVEKLPVNSKRHSIGPQLDGLHKLEASQWEGQPIAESPIWCMDFSSDLIILGCADGRLEFWEASSGKLMCVWWEGCTGEECGVTAVRALGGARRVVAARLGGHLLLLRLDVYNPASGARVDWRFSTAHRRTHVRTSSAGSIQTQPTYDSKADWSTENLHRLGTSPPHSFMRNDFYNDYDEEVRCVRIAYSKPHQQPISEMEAEGGRIVTGGQDHILKVFSSSDLSPLFTLHGHCGPITSCFIDRVTPTIGGSGSQDGLLCVWDLHTGTCLYSIQAHDGAVTSLSYTASYVISAGSDERLCIWDRFQGHMLNSIHIGLSYTSSMLPLTHSLLLMGDRNGMSVFDLSTGDVVRRVLLGQSDGCVFVRQILPLKDAIVCDYGHQLRIVRFPLVSTLSTDSKND